MRDKSCKDVESYFTELLEGGNNDNFRIIWNFIEKNMDKPLDRRTAISVNEININWVYYPKGYLFRLDTNWDLIKWIEPLRMTMFSWWKDLWKEWWKAFSYQYEEYYNNYTDLLLQYENNSADLIDIFKKVLSK